MKLRKIICTLVTMLVYVLQTTAQPGEWIWMNGSSNMAGLPVHGTQGIPAPGNTPGAIYEGAWWTDTAGNFWLFGGQHNSFLSVFADMWKFDPNTAEWTWVKGPGGSFSTIPVFGIKGVASASNTPGYRAWAPSCWTDKQNRLWMFGGHGSNGADLNDLWMYDIATNNWTWMHGPQNGTNGNYGVQGVPSPTNQPPARHECSATWVDTSGNLWMYGGYLNFGEGGDLWHYNISTNEWTFMAGSTVAAVFPNWGFKYIAAPSNYPGCRNTYTSWHDGNNGLYMFGGMHNDGAINDTYNDVWLFDIGTNLFTWVGGTSNVSTTGYYGAKCDPDFNKVPSTRFENSSSVEDACHNMWMFGGNHGLSQTAILGDFWHFNTSNYEWTLLGGDTTLQSSGYSFGTQGVSSPTNKPPARQGAYAWMDKQNNFWLFGGTNSSFQMRNDIWKYQLDTTCIQYNFSCISNPALPQCAFQSSDTILCEKSAINFFDLSSGNPTTWNWTFTGAVPSASTNQNPTGIYYATYGTFPVTLVVSNGAGSDSLTLVSFISVVPNPPKPNVTFNGTDLCSDSAVAYQWFYNNAPIANANGQCYTPTQVGSYYVQITDSNGCQSASDVFVVNSVSEHSNLSFQLFPNPATNTLTVTWSHAYPVQQLYITEQQGRMVKSISCNADINLKSIDIADLAAGMYYLHVQANNTISNRRFIKLL